MVLVFSESVADPYALYTDPDTEPDPAFLTNKKLDPVPDPDFHC